MIATKFWTWALLFAVLGAARTASAQEKAEQRLSTAEFERLHNVMKPQPGESRWMEVAWYPAIWEARQKAAAEGKPLFIWAGSGGAPAAGC